MDRKRIRELNDTLRTTFTGGRVLMTAGVNALSEVDKAAVLRKVQTFDGFNRDNDPYGEHDFVNIEHGGESISLKSITTLRTWKVAQKTPLTPTKRHAF
jgi:Protein of unknown function (DUF3768)